MGKYVGLLTIIQSMNSLTYMQWKQGSKNRESMLDLNLL